MPPLLSRSATPSDREQWYTNVALLERYEGLSRASAFEPDHSRPDDLEATGYISRPEPYVPESYPDSAEHDPWVVTL